MGAARSANKKTGPLGYATYGALRAAMMAPQMLPDILNVTIAANEPKADQ